MSIASTRFYTYSENQISRCWRILGIKSVNVDTFWAPNRLVMTHSKNPNQLVLTKIGECTAWDNTENINKKYVVFFFVTELLFSIQYYSTWSNRIQLTTKCGPAQLQLVTVIINIEKLPFCSHTLKRWWYRVRKLQMLWVSLETDIHFQPLP